jgi:hypothetical protein
VRVYNVEGTVPIVSFAEIATRQVRQAGRIVSFALPRGPQALFCFHEALGDRFGGSRPLSTFCETSRTNAHQLRSDTTTVHGPPRRSSLEPNPGRRWSGRCLCVRLRLGGGMRDYCEESMCLTLADRCLACNLCPSSTRSCALPEQRPKKETKKQKTNRKQK